MTETSYKSVLTRFENQTTFYFTYVDKDIYEIKKMTVKRFDDIAILQGNCKDSLIIAYKGVDDKIFFDVVSNYSAKDKLYFYHWEMTRITTPLIKQSLKTCFKNDKLTWTEFRQRTEQNILSDNPVYDVEGYRTLKSFSKVQLELIKNVVQKIDDEQLRNSLDSVLISYSKRYSELLSEVNFYNETRRKELEEISKKQKIEELQKKIVERDSAEN